MQWRGSLVAGAAAFILLVAGQARADAPTFATTIVQPATRSGEPSIAIDGQHVYVAQPTGGPGVSGDVLYHSNDGGVTFDRRPLSTGGSGDSDVAVDGDGVVYVSDLFGPNHVLPVSVSVDHGQTFVRTVSSARPGTYDRQWTAAVGHGHVVNVVHGSGFEANVTFDGAQTFIHRSIDPAGTMSGPPVFTSDGSVVYAPYAASTDLRVARSLDGGDTWTTAHVATLGSDLVGFTTLDFPVAAVDATGTVYVVWVTGNSLSTTGPVWMSRSSDGGVTWSPKIAVSAPGGSVVMPWIVAGGTGHVSVAYYQASTQFGDRGPELGSADYTWDVVLAQSFDASSETPTVTNSAIATNVHRGSICTLGTGCRAPESLGFVNAPLPFDRRVLDFFEIALDPSGRVVAAYPVDRPVYGGNGGLDDVIYSNADLTVARQVTGPAM